MNLESQLQAGIRESEKTLDHFWKMAAFRGAVAIAFGITLLVWPNIGLSVMIALFAAFALVIGVTTVVGAFSMPIKGGERAWIVFEGLLGIAAGVVVLVWPDLSARALLFAIGAWAIATGMADIVLGFALPYKGGRNLLVVLGGVLSIAFGVVMFAKPGAGAIVLVALVAALALVAGTLQIALAIEMRSKVKELEKQVDPFASSLQSEPKVEQRKQTKPTVAHSH